EPGACTNLPPRRNAPRGGTFVHISPCNMHKIATSRVGPARICHLAPPDAVSPPVTEARGKSPECGGNTNNPSIPATKGIDASQDTGETRRRGIGRKLASQP